MLRAMLRDLRAHKGRIAMTLVAIVLGVAFVVATWVIADSTAASSTATATRSDVDVAVRGPAAHPALTTADARRLAELPGVDEVTAVHAAPASLVGEHGKIIPGGHARAGTGWDDTGRFTLTEGRAPAAGEVALSVAAAAESGLAPGEEARVILADGREARAEVAGIFEYRTLGVESVPAVAFAAADATALLGDAYDRLELRTTAGASGASVVEAVRRAMTAPDLTVHTGEELVAEHRDDADEAARSTRESLLAFAAVALLVGTFVIANTFTMLVTQRVRQFALLRAVGASRRQVRRTVLLEAATLGFVGATVGVAAGVALGLLGMWAFTPADESVTYSVTPPAIAIGYLAGIGVTATAAWASARRAAAVAPVAALRTDSGGQARPHPARRRTVAGTALLVTGVLAVAFISGDGLSNAERVLCLTAGVVAWLGVLLLAPVLATAALRPVARIAGRRGGPVVRLATRNAVRDPRRTAATSSALLVGLALVCAFATLGETMVSMLGAAVRTTVPANATILRSASGADPLGSDVLDRARAAPGVERVAADRYALVGVTYAGGTSRTSVSAIEPAGFGAVLTPKIVEGSGDLRRGVVVGTNQAAMLGIGVGDEVALEFPGAPPVRQRIVGLIETVEGQPLFYLDVSRAPDWLRDRVTTVYAIGEARAALEATFADRPDVTVTDREGVLAEDVEDFQLLLSVMYAMFGAAIVIAVFGVINTLALSVIERTREIGVLRAVGAARRLVRRTVRFESLVICAYGGVLGIVVGLLFGAVMQHVMLGNPLFDIGVPYVVILISLAGMVLVGVLSALWPARRAARTDVLDAIKTE
ncbi:FtsX-like permease family protein [Actinophytocola sp. NPDC049390]|uniref:FtsX-like permease family protein n=1 Tax=Actinophytocola sp. NPDC049390 TaxID=3363894 RepID=UPI0037A72BAB